MAEPIQVKPGTLPEVVATAARYAAVFIGGILVQRGTFTAEQWADFSGWALGAIPLAIGMWAAHRNKTKLITAAEAAPDRVAVVK